MISLWSQNSTYYLEVLQSSPIRFRYMALSKRIGSPFSVPSPAVVHRHKTALLPNDHAVVLRLQTTPPRLFGPNGRTGRGGLV